MGQGVATGTGHKEITFVLQTQFPIFLFLFLFLYIACGQNQQNANKFSSLFFKPTGQTV